MQKVVVDSSVVIKWFVPQAYLQQAQKIFDEYLASRLLLLAPDLIYAELGNILWKMQRFQNIPEVEIRSALALLEQIDLHTFSSSSLLEDAYQIAIAHQRTVYDSLYVALSVQQQCPFLTADRKLVNAISGAFPNVISIADRP